MPAYRHRQDALVRCQCSLPQQLPQGLVVAVSAGFEPGRSGGPGRDHPHPHAAVGLGHVDAAQQPQRVPPCTCTHGAS
jgi:hypothetical protein